MAATLHRPADRRKRQGSGTARALHRKPLGGELEWVQIFLNMLGRKGRRYVDKVANLWWACSSAGGTCTPRDVLVQTLGPTQISHARASTERVQGDLARPRVWDFLNLTTSVAVLSYAAGED